MPRRNLVFIMSDQQRRDSIGCYGSGWAENAESGRPRVFGLPVRERVRDPGRVYARTGVDHDGGYTRTPPGRS